jgi:hypothetical protein
MERLEDAFQRRELSLVEPTILQPALEVQDQHVLAGGCLREAIELIVEPVALFRVCRWRFREIELAVRRQLRPVDLLLAADDEQM